MIRKKNRLLWLMAAGLLFVTGCTSGSSQQTPSDMSAGSEQTETEKTEDTKDDDLDLGGTALKSGQDLSQIDGNARIESGGSYTLKGNLGGTLVVDAEGEDVTIELDGVSIQTAGPAVFVRKASAVTLIFRNDCSLASSEGENSEILNAAVYSRSDLIIDGNGRADITCMSGHGIKAKDTLELTGITGSITAGKDGIHSNEDAQINASLSIQADDEGIQSEQKLTIAGGSLTIASTGDCLRAETEFSGQDGSHVLASAQNEGIESKDSLVITGGSWQINAYDDGLNAASLLQIDGGNVSVFSENNDAIDSNGSLLINGGSVTALSRQNPEGAFDTDNTPFEINGGTVLGIGPMGCYPSAEGQNVLMIGGSGSITSFALQDSAGNTLYAFEDFESRLTGGSQTITFSSPDLKTGMEVQIVINGSQTASLVIEEGLTQTGNIMSMLGGQGMPGGQEMPGGNPGGMMEPPADGDFENRPPDAGLNPPAKPVK